jgi:hypothetical protein
VQSLLATICSLVKDRKYLQERFGEIETKPLQYSKDGVLITSEFPGSRSFCPSNLEFPHCTSFSSQRKIILVDLNMSAPQITLPSERGREDPIYKPALKPSDDPSKSAAFIFVHGLADSAEAIQSKYAEFETSRS